MKKILCTAIALAFMSAPVYAGPVKMTTAQLDEVTAAGNGNGHAYGHVKKKVVVVVNKTETNQTINQSFENSGTIKIIAPHSSGTIIVGNVATQTATTVVKTEVK
jgi:hypothetical protein